MFGSRLGVRVFFTGVAFVLLCLPRGQATPALDRLGLRTCSDWSQLGRDLFTSDAQRNLRQQLSETQESLNRNRALWLEVGRVLSLRNPRYALPHLETFLRDSAQVDRFPVVAVRFARLRAIEASLANATRVAHRFSSDNFRQELEMGLCDAESRARHGWILECLSAGFPPGALPAGQTVLYTMRTQNFTARMRGLGLGVNRARVASGIANALQFPEQCPPPPDDGAGSTVGNGAAVVPYHIVPSRLPVLAVGLPIGVEVRQVPSAAAPTVVDTVAAGFVAQAVRTVLPGPLGQVVTPMLAPGAR